MDIRRLTLAFVMPPAAVMNKEAGTIMLTGLLTLLGWVPGVVAALVMINQEQKAKQAGA
ncbi:MAG: YqaE/Pmp3 family membrane protein [Chlorobiaceae bacterium]|nr:YqaE/Pmp3 family membrane protein [Chlorobiaceae bacterium]